MEPQVTERGMNRKAEFLFLTEELWSHILSFLPWRDILRCASVCKALHQTYVSSSELQYIVELGGQRLLPVFNTDLDNRTPVSKRLQLLRNGICAWFKFDINSVETVSIPDQYHDGRLSLANRHLCLYSRDEDSAKIFPILPKPSQQIIERDLSLQSLCSVPNTDSIDVFMDPTQNLIAIAYGIFQPGDVKLFVELGALDRSGAHPQAAGRTLFMLGPPQCENIRFEPDSGKLKGFGRHIAFWCSLRFDNAGNLARNQAMWWLQIWDWQHSMTSISVLGDTFNSVPDDSMDFCFLGRDKLLIANYSLKIYSIKDMSKAPQLLACFLLPVPPMMKIRIFFDLDVFEGMVPTMLWKYWGPLNARVFYDQYPWVLGVSGNRVLFRAADNVPGSVKHRQGLGRVVKEPSTIKISEWGEEVTTCLPYVEVVLDRRMIRISLSSRSSRSTAKSASHEDLFRLEPYKTDALAQVSNDLRSSCKVCHYVFWVFPGLIGTLSLACLALSLFLWGAGYSKSNNIGAVIVIPTGAFIGSIWTIFTKVVHKPQLVSVEATWTFALLPFEICRTFYARRDPAFIFSHSTGIANVPAAYAAYLCLATLVWLNAALDPQTLGPTLENTTGDVSCSPHPLINIRVPTAMERPKPIAVTLRSR
ncbi:uncharacterized protein EDB93DRAFT_1101948 [Suillus bovinus]|uniref:uncharacterized protein n=1 Tax=Suillus bovinus TaxID=48563 RepID=UPI001B873259|nr:uncharacterized protein EDB93DRAFT_1101948 [Suillus bovinus]KAG2154932.1 hypothetical protein EDB93DRAFT_1101948 [Suillus bovinus]